MKMALILSLGFLASSSLVAQDIQWQVGNCYVSAKAGQSIAADKSTYFFVPVTAKNVATKEMSVGGLDADFELHQGDYVYKNDGGVGWKYVRGFYDGLEVLAPLNSKTFVVIFTVPIEEVAKPWTLTFPDGQSAALAGLFKTEPKKTVHIMVGGKGEGRATPAGNVDQRLAGTENKLNTVHKTPWNLLDAKQGAE